MTLEDLFAIYLRKNRNVRAQSTQRSYRVAIGHFSGSLGHKATIADLSDDSLIAIERHLQERSDYTINGVVGRIKALWRFACKQNIMQCWPTLDPMRLPEPSKPTWSPDQVRTLLQATQRLKRLYDGVPCRLWWDAYLRCLWDTGERQGAMRACRWEHLDGRVLAIPAKFRKGHKPAVYMLSESTLEALDKIRKPARNIIFPWPLSDCTYYAHFGSLLKRAGLPTDRKSKSQRFRRTHLTLWESAGHDATTRAQHTSRAVTEKFYLDRSKLPQVDPTNILPPL